MATLTTLPNEVPRTSLQLHYIYPPHQPPPANTTASQLLIHILNYLPSLSLLWLLRVSLGIHILILQLLHQCIPTAMTLHYLIFECYSTACNTTSTTTIIGSLYS